MAMTQSMSMKHMSHITKARGRCCEDEDRGVAG